MNTMRKIKTLFIALTMLIASSCSEEEANKEVVQNIKTKMAQDYKDIFFSEEFMDLSKEDMSNYISQVSEEYGIDIASLSQSQAISYFDSINFNECFLEKLQDPTTINWIQYKSDAMNEALNNKDTAAMEELAIWFYNLYECDPIDRYDDLIKDIDATVVKNSYYSSEANNILKKDYPIIESLDENDKIFILTLASYYKNNEKEMITKAASTKAQRCKNSLDKAVRNAYIMYGVGMATCSLTIPSVVGCWICVAGVSAQLYVSMDAAYDSYNNCMQ